MNGLLLSVIGFILVSIGFILDKNQRSKNEKRKSFIDHKTGFIKDLTRAGLYKKPH